MWRVRENDDGTSLRNGVDMYKNERKQQKETEKIRSSNKNENVAADAVKMCNFIWTRRICPNGGWWAKTHR